MINITKVDQLPPDAKKVHLIPYQSSLKPRGTMAKNSLGLYILMKLVSAYESWTDPSYSDNPEETVLVKTLVDNVKNEADAAIRTFLETINKDEEYYKRT